jgi:hypothetical protein
MAAVLIPRSLFMVVGATAAVVVMSGDAHSGVRGLLSEVSRTVVHYVSRPSDAALQAQMAAQNGGRGAASAVLSAIPSYLQPLADQLNSLSRDVARMRGDQISLRPSSSTTLFVVVGGVGAALALYVSGSSLTDVVWVTRSHFNSTVTALKDGVRGVAVALAKVRQELAQKIGVVERKVDESRDHLEKRIAAEVGDVRRDLALAHEDVRGVAKGQQEVRSVLTTIEGQVSDVGQRVEDAQGQLHRANRGIYLLCNVVADSAAVASSNRAVYEELLQFTREAKKHAAKTPVVPPQQQQQALPQRNPGLKMLVGPSASSAVLKKPALFSSQSRSAEDDPENTASAANSAAAYGDAELDKELMTLATAFAAAATARS